MTAGLLPALFNGHSLTRDETRFDQLATSLSGSGLSKNLFFFFFGAGSFDLQLDFYSLCQRVVSGQRQYLPMKLTLFYFGAQS